MFQSFIVYGIFGFLLFLFGYNSYLASEQYVFKDIEPSFCERNVFLGLFIFAFFSGIRWNVGVDYQAYLANFLSIQNGRSGIFDKELGFEYFTYLVAVSGFHFSFYFGFLAFIQLFFIYYAYKNERYLYPFIGIIILFGPEYLNLMNGIRQMIAASMFLYSIKFIQQKKILFFLIIILTSSLIHKSSIVLLGFYFIPPINYFKNRLFVCVLFVTTIILGNNSDWIKVFNDFGAVLDFLDYDNISSKLNRLILDNQVRNFGPRRIILILLTVIVIWLSKKMFIYFKGTAFQICYNFSILGALLFNLLSNTHHIFIRPLNYLTIFFVPTLAYLLVYLKESTDNIRLKFYLVLFLVLAYLPISVISDYGKGKYDFVNYKFFWERPFN